MDNNQKILIAAIIIILIILVGAFALSGSNNATPSVTPTATPVITATPTPLPTGGSGGASSSTPTPTVVVSATPTPTPSVTATPEPASGVKQTEFGYWITYPPLGPENWSAPNPNLSQGVPNNTVYFDPTSGALTFSTARELALTVDENNIYTAYIYRKGDASQAINVTVQTGNSSNFEVDSFSGSYWLMEDSTHVHFIDGSDNKWNITFLPGETAVAIPIKIWAGVNGGSGLNTGTVTVTIIHADGGFNYGYQKDFTLNIDKPVGVWFGETGPGMNYGYMNYGGTGITFDTSIDHIASNGSYTDVFLPVVRDTDSGTVTVNFYWNYYGDGLSNEGILIGPYTFAAGHTDGLAKVSIPTEDITEESTGDLSVYIDSGTGYLVGNPDDFDIYLDYDG